MKKFEKTYIGKGKQIGDLQIVRVSCKIAELVKLAHEYKGEQYITFEVAKLQFPDSFGHEYTAYVNKMVETVEPAPVGNFEKRRAAEKKTKKAPELVPAESEADLPF